MKKIWKDIFNLNNFVIFICLAWLFVMVFNNLFGSTTPLVRNNGLTRRQAEIQVKNTGKTLKLTVELAASPEELHLGLSNRAMLEKGFGMYFVLPRRDFMSFWMKDMRFPIDIIWIDKGKVVGIDKNCPIPKDPNNIPTFKSPKEVTNVLEVDAGFSEQNKIEVGDLVNLLN